MNAKKNHEIKGNWFKQVILDVLVTGLVVISTFWMPPFLRYLLYGYTCLLLVVRVITLLGNGMNFMMNRKSSVKVPNWFYHVNYFACTAIFFITAEYILGSLWALIWLLSWISILKTSHRVARSKKG